MCKDAKQSRERLECDDFSIALVTELNAKPQSGQGARK
jgi:hypothetical protein